MLIQCTKNLLDKMRIDKNELVDNGGHEQFPNSLTAWHANLVNLNRRKAVVIMNNETRYPIVLYRPKPKDFSRLKELIPEAIVVAFRMMGVREDIIENYLAAAGEVVFSKTANRSMVARMNNTVNEVGFMQENLDENTLIQRYISIAAGRFIQTVPNGEGFYPAEKLLECLRIYSDSPQDVRAVDLYQLKITIDIEGFDIWRRVLVPSTFSFRHLHNIIQTVFDWQNYHLHRFEIEQSGMKPLQIIMDDDPDTLEWLDPDTYDILQERFVALKDIFPEADKVLYEYDFGDSWEHTITLEKVVQSHEFNAVYLEGAGERPPEDVGGSWGYHEYQRVMADETDPEHESMKVWAQSQKERKMSSETINDRLKRLALSRYHYSPNFY